MSRPPAVQGHAPSAPGSLNGLVPLSVDEVARALPPAFRSHADQQLADLVNNAANDPEAARVIRENFLSYTNVLREGRFRTDDYVNAVVYVSYKLMGYSNVESYQRTFPNRYTALLARGASDKDISAYVAAFSKNKLVNLILEQTLVPMWLLNQDAYQKAINTQVFLMEHARSEKVRSEAANSLLTHLKKPEKHQVELDIGVKENSGMSELKDMLTSLAQRQMELIEQGVSTRDIAHQKLIDGTAEEVDDERDD